MTPLNIDAKEKLLQAVLDMLDEGVDPQKLTTRDIAGRAGVNIALVNYHFQSKDNLVQQAVGIKLSGITNEMYDLKNFNADPVEKLRDMIKRISAMMLQYRFLMRTAISFELKNASYATAQIIIPILREIYGDQKTERELQLIALQFLVPLQTMYVYQEMYQKVWGLEMRRESVNQVIDVFMANLFQK